MKVYELIQLLGIMPAGKEVSVSIIGQKNIDFPDVITVTNKDTVEIFCEDADIFHPKHGCPLCKVSEVTMHLDHLLKPEDDAS